METQVLLFFSIAGIWLLGISIVLYRVFVLFNRLTRGVEEDLSKKGFAEVRKRLDFLEEESQSHMQKVGFVRFNPF